MTFNWFNRAAQPEEPTTPAPEEPQAPAESSVPDPQEALTFAKAAYERLKQKQQAAAQQANVQQTDADAKTDATTDSSTDSSTDSGSVLGGDQGSDAAEAQPDEDQSAISESETSESETTKSEEIGSEASESVVTEVENTNSPIVKGSDGELAEPIEVASVTATAAIAIEDLSAEPNAEPSPESSPEPIVRPVWMQAQAETEARLEEFRQAAIVTEPEPQPEPKTKAVEYVFPPDLILDDGFTWSAELLAAQGRRVEDISLEEITWLKRLRQGLDKTRRNLVNQLKAIVGQGPLNQDAVDEIESLLLQADVGVAATDKIIAGLQTKLRQEVLPPEQAIAFLKQLLREMLDAPYSQGGYKRGFSPEKDKLNIWMMTGVNGAGKTTTIGKITHVASKSGYKCLIAAADTFRAAAVEQVKVWGARSGVEVISNPGQNTDPAAVVFDAISAAQSRGTELLLIDTAGRLQNKKNLMDELAKVRRIIDKKVGSEVHIETLLVLDSTLGQNGLQQAKVFSEAAQITGVVLTKLDGTAKGGIALAVVEQLGLPIRFIGAGEGIEDLRPFSGYEFVEALISG